jgi:hypothetical protein
MVDNGSSYRGVGRALALAAVCVLFGCGGPSKDAQGPGAAQGSEMTGEGGGQRFADELEDVDPAEHDIEVPPAP